MPWLWVESNSHVGLSASDAKLAETSVDQQQRR